MAFEQSFTHRKTAKTETAHGDIQYFTDHPFICIYFFNR